MLDFAEHDIIRVRLFFECKQGPDFLVTLEVND